MVMFGYCFSKLAMTFCGLVVQVHQVSVTLGDAEAVAAVPANTPSSVAAAAPIDNSLLNFMCYPLVEIPDLFGPDLVGTPWRVGDEPPTEPGPASVGSAPNPTVWQRSRGGAGLEVTSCASAAAAA